MKMFRQLGIVALLLVSYLTPAMACVISSVQMNATGRACCRVMQSQCDKMSMPASHGCCQKTSMSAHENALITKAVSDQQLAASAAYAVAPAWFQPAPIATGWVEHADVSPPQSPPHSISVLRI